MALALTPVVETTIEGKHAKVALEPQGKLGPVRVSLANRLELIESRLTLSPDTMQRLVRELHRTRSLRKIPALFSFADHALLRECIPEDKRRRPSYYAAPCAAIIYRCDIHSLFQSYSGENKRHARKQDSDRRKGAHLFNERDHVGPGRAKPPPVTADSCMQALMLDHFRSVARTTGTTATVFQIPTSACQMVPLGSFLGNADSVGESKRREVEAADASMAPDMDVGASLDAPGDPEGAGIDTMFFRCVHLQPSDKKQVKLAPGAGRRIRSTAIAITPLTRFGADGGENIVSTEPAVTLHKGRREPILLLSEFTDTAILQRECTWATRQKALCYRFDEKTQAGLAVDAGECQEVLAALGQATAWPDSDRDVWYVAKSHILSSRVRVASRSSCVLESFVHTRFLGGQNGPATL